MKYSNCLLISMTTKKMRKVNFEKNEKKYFKYFTCLKLSLAKVKNNC